MTVPRIHLAAIRYCVHMEMFDWMFPEPAQAMHLRSIAHSMRTHSRNANRSARRASVARDEIEDDLGFVALVLMSLVGSLIEKGVIQEEDLAAHIKRLDTLDGIEDGKLNPDMLRGAMGLSRKPEEQPETPAPTPTRKRRRS